MVSPTVCSCKKWDQLEEIIVGSPLRARFPPPDPSTQVAEYHDSLLSKMLGGGFIA